MSEAMPRKNLRERSSLRVDTRERCYRSEAYEIKHDVQPYIQIQYILHSDPGVALCDLKTVPFVSLMSPTVTLS